MTTRLQQNREKAMNTIHYYRWHVKAPIFQYSNTTLI